MDAWPLMLAIVLALPVAAFMREIYPEDWARQSGATI
jgi:hypothetical protein